MERQMHRIGRQLSQPKVAIHHSTILPFKQPERTNWRRQIITSQRSMVSPPSVDLVRPVSHQARLFHTCSWKGRDIE
eukprot:scaffold13933_cov219-Amphora_coffeaeformis.AAC.14